MNQGQRLGLIGAAIVAAVALVVVLVGVAAPGKKPLAGRHASSRSGASIPATTQDLLPVPSGTATTTRVAPISVPTTLAPPTTTTAAPPPTQGASGTFLTPPGSTDVRIADPLNCSAVDDGPRWFTRCGVAHASGVDLMWAIESMGVPGGTAWHVYALRHLQGYQWQVMLAVADDTGQRQWTAVNAAAVDVTGDGSQDLVFGFHYPEPAAVLVADVVGAPGRVNLHQSILEGAVQLTPGQLDEWGAGPGGVGYGHEVLRYLSGAWRIVSSVPAPPVIPASSV